MDKRRSLLKQLLLVLSFILLFNTANSQLTFEKDEYSARREKLMDMIPDGIMIIRGATTPTGLSRFYQYNELVYFCGVEIPDIILLIDGIKRESHLFMTIEEKHARSEGLNIELVKDPSSVSGIKNISPYNEFASVLGEKLSDSKIIYAPFCPNELAGEISREKRNSIRKNITGDEWDGRLNRNLQFIEKLKERFSGLIIKDCSPIIWDLRKIKSKAEIEIMREAGRIGVEGHKSFMKATGNNVTEQYLANLFEFTCKNEGAYGLAYTAIIMSDINHAYGHYNKYDRTLKDGDFIILDAGPDYKNYAADISTTFPANGKFTKNQKEDYELAQFVNETCLKNYKPGITLADVGRKIKEAMIKKGYDIENRRAEKWFKYGGYNHSIGMAVHDGMATFDGTNEILKPGFVFACDIMTRTDSVTSVRIEDTVVITEDGCENLSRGLPRTIKEIEAFMQK